MFPYEPDNRDKIDKKIQKKSFGGKFMTFASAAITFWCCRGAQMIDFQIQCTPQRI